MAAEVPKETAISHVENKAAMAAFTNNESTVKTTAVIQDWDEKEERSIVRKVDFTVLPILAVLMGLSFLDRNNISAAYIAGMDQDLELRLGARYNIALLVFFIGYALFELPSNYILRIVGARVWIPILVLLWGICCLLMGFVTNWWSLVILRAFLGVFEAGLWPGTVYLIGAWYKQYEAAKRITFCYMTGVFASGLSPIFAYALSLIRVGDGMYRQGWRWIYIIEGIVTIVVAIIAPPFMMEFPQKARMLSERQRHIAIKRLETENVSTSGNHSIKEFLGLLLDKKLIVFAFQYYVATVSVYALGYFQPLILRDGMGFNYTKSQLLSTPTYFFAIAASFAVAAISDKFRLRWPFIVAQCIVCCVGLLIVLYAGKPGVRYFGLYLGIYGAQSNLPMFLSYAQNQITNVEKKGAFAAAMITVGAVGGTTGSTIFRPRDAPTYYPGMWTTIALQIAVAIVTYFFSMWLERQNKLADEGKLEVLEDVEGFRYAP
ncbi:hypothetical protein PV10_07485 [Exophiala mesophila]|uniref:Major facilitator superfamily (MFS) profile domain-containing protein n=1 Tax=Exophiala mesophila TaxID=212818 RepID=A0A0D1WMB3_EXOME|nr:uncharacterized protein PV10_07485 [Exophiala mesophila]KIV90145.1 hypothetical protein PV10_07485 [Exophiala mesophila]